MGQYVCELRWLHIYMFAEKASPYGDVDEYDGASQGVLDWLFLGNYE